MALGSVILKWLTSIRNSPDSTHFKMFFSFDLKFKLSIKSKIDLFIISKFFIIPVVHMSLILGNCFYEDTQVSIVLN